MAGKAKNPAEPETSIEPHYFFGLQVDVTPSILYLDEGSVVHPVGHNVAVFNIENRRQRLISGMPWDGSSPRKITAMAMPPRRNAIAIAEKGERAVIYIYDTQFLRKKKTLSTSEVLSNEYVSLAYADNKTILSQGGAPDWTLVLWSVDKGKSCSGKISNAQNSPIYHVSLCPEDPRCCWHRRHDHQIFRVQDGAFKPVNPNLSKREPQNYLAHAWLPDDKSSSPLTMHRYCCSKTQNYVLSGQQVRMVALSIVSPYTQKASFVVVKAESYECLKNQKMEGNHSRGRQLWRLTIIGIPLIVWLSIYPARKI